MTVVQNMSRCYLDTQSSVMTPGVSGRSASYALGACHDSCDNSHELVWVHDVSLLLSLSLLRQSLLQA